MFPEKTKNPLYDRNYCSLVNYWYCFND